ncbi:MAG: hypothetical protein AAFO80_12535 [Pseudomonadota bacterium]
MTSQPMQDALDTYAKLISGFEPLPEDQLLAIIAAAAGHYRGRVGGGTAAEALRDLADQLEAGQMPVTLQ